jgi:surface protein
MNKMFYNCSSLSLLPDISKWKIDNIFCIDKMFYNCSSLSSLPNISEWNIKNNLDISYLINDCTSLISLPDIQKTKIQNMSMSSGYERSSSIIKLIYEVKGEKIIKIFDNKFVNKNQGKCKMIINNKVYLLKDKYHITENNIKFLKIKLMILNNVKIDLSYIFNECNLLKEFYVIPREDIKQQENQLIKKQKYYKNESDLDDSDNQLFQKFYPSNKTNKMSNIKNNNINSDILSIYKNKFNLIFCYCKEKRIPDDEKKVMDQFFILSFNFFSLPTFIDTTIFQNIINENSSEISIDSTISECNNINNKTVEKKSFDECFYAVRLILSNSFKRNTIIATDMSNMFYGCSSLISISGISKFNTRNVIDMSSMFEKCYSLIYLDDISKWDTRNVNYINEMFGECSKLESLPDISKWNIDSIIEMSGLFYDCISLSSLPDISIWNTSYVNNMSGLFMNCQNLRSLPDISRWNVDNVYDINGLFAYCSSIKSIPDISNWNIDNVDDLSCLFSNCVSLKELPDLSNWNTYNVDNMSQLFFNCEKLISFPDISR